SDFHDLALANLEIAKAIKSYDAKRILTDHRRVTYRLNQSDAFNLVRLYERKGPEFKGVALACCVTKDNMVFKKYWEEIGRVRGFLLKAFTDIDEAREWLLETNGSLDKS
ncbi:MAG: hypothetical protein R3345_12530, partial [Fulvivirga sp.]|nr:hypothetical protein [Fulvivirga sp.]